MGEWQKIAAEQFTELFLAVTSNTEFGGMRQPPQHANCRCSDGVYDKFPGMVIDITATPVPNDPSAPLLLTAGEAFEAETAIYDRLTVEKTEARRLASGEQE